MLTQGLGVRRANSELLVNSFDQNGISRMEVPLRIPPEFNRRHFGWNNPCSWPVGVQAVAY